MAKHIALAAKDTTTARCFKPLINELRKRGNKTSVLLEGLASTILAEYSTDESLIAQKNMPLDQAKAMQFLQQHHPDILVVGTSNPNWSEKILVEMAGEISPRIPTVCFSDLWNGESRLGHAAEKLNLLLVIDHAAEALAVHRYPHIPVSVVGDPVTNECDEICTRLWEIRNLLSSYSNPDTFLLVVGQGYEYLEDVMEIALQSISRSHQWMLLPRLWHPKKGPNERLAAIWDTRSAELRRQGRIIELGEDASHLSTDDLAVACGGTMSVFSTPLRFAALMRKRVLSVSTESTRTGMAKSLGVHQYPPVTFTEALEVNAPVSIDDLPASLPRLTPRFSALKAADTILELLP